MIFCMIIYFHIEERHPKNNKLFKTNYNDKTITAGNACMSNTKTLLKYFTNVKAVGKGSFGTVYIGTLI